MVLCDADRDLFYTLNRHLLFYASEQLEFLPRPGSPADIRDLAEEDWRRLRDGLYEHVNLFDSFVGQNPFGFTADELAIVRSWKGFRRGRFLVWRYLKKYTVFIDDSAPPRAIGVVALNKPFQFMLGPHLPVAIEAVLLPFRDAIIYDGLFVSYPVRFGAGFRRMLADEYRRAKAGEGIVTSFAQLAAGPGVQDKGDRRRPRRPAKKATAAARPRLYRLKVTLLGLKPRIWRRLLVRGDTTLARLHMIVQTAMGWWDYHLHTFTVRGKVYSVPDPEWDVADERRVKLDRLGLGPRCKFRYMYDMGDGWDHEILVEAVTEADRARPRRAVCLDGRRACPPEDVGGTGGYEYFLEAIRDPNHKEHREMQEWIGREFDPEAFSVAETDQDLKGV